MNRNKKLLVISLIILMLFSSMIVLSGCSEDRSKCTICGKPATHHTSNYGFCDKHWESAMNYKG